MPPRQFDRRPIDFAIHDFKPGNARGRAAIRTGHAARIEKQNATAPFITRHMRVPMQNNIDIFRDMIRRNMLETEL